MLELAVLRAALLTAPLAASLGTGSLGLDLHVIDARSSDAHDDEAQLDSPLPTPPSFAQLALLAQPPKGPKNVQPAPVDTGGETLQGFDSLLLTQINALFGSENLPLANGSPVEPGMYVTVSAQQALIFDTKIIDLQAGAVPPGPSSRECKSGCKTSLWSPFRQMWLRALEEAQSYTLEIPARVLFAVEASVPAKTVLELAYAAAETRPSGPPNFSLLVNGSNAGLRARTFYLLPPGGLRVAPGDNALGLRITLGAGESFTISAAHPRFSPNIQGVGWKDLSAQLVAVKKGYPNKESVIIDVGDDATIGDVVNTMLAAQNQFGTVVLTNGIPVKWG
jgi:hypothetical protein